MRPGWEDVTDLVDTWTHALADKATQLKFATAELLVPYHVGVYLDPQADVVGVWAPDASLGDISTIKLAVGDFVPLTERDLASTRRPWVKVAHSPTLARVGELLNFFPGQYTNGIPNHPYPLAAMLTTGLLGAGLGYGTGKLLTRVLPDRYGDKLPRSGAIVGGLLGAAPGAVMMLGNAAAGKPLNTNDYFVGPDPLRDARDVYRQMPQDPDIVAANRKTASAFAGFAPALPHTPADVNVDAMGRTLYEAGASPALASTALASLYAADRFPDTNQKPGWITGQQLGQLAMNAGGDYLKGVAVGRVLNTVVGTPYRPAAFGAGNVALGIIGTVIPKLFGG